MIVTVHLHTILQRRTADGVEREVTVTLPPGSRVSDLLEELAVSLAPSALLFLVNGRVAAIDHPLSDGDEVHLIPAISGGRRRQDARWQGEGYSVS